MFFNDSFEDFHLDIVGFLAILGEGSVSVNYQVSTLSAFTFLPRLLPAPQAFMRPSRPLRLDDVPGTVLGIRSGNCRPHVCRIPHIILPGDESMKSDSDYTVRHYRITIKDGGNPSDALISARAFSLLSVLAVIGCAMSIALLGLSIHFNDGWALVATVLLSCLSSLLGIMCKWSLKLGKRVTGRDDIPSGDVIICYPNGAFIIVECEEAVARSLFFAPERCNYLLSGTWYRSLALLGTMMLMFGVIALGNSGARMQVTFGASYLLLNAAYWMVAALPEKLHWDYSALHLEEVAPVFPAPGEDRSFRKALWAAIKSTKSTRWVKTGRIAPDTEAWHYWLGQAESAVTRLDGFDPETWDYSARLDDCLGTIGLFTDSPGKPAAEERP
ncbi:hypothetical protein BDV32DRAFT_112331 [Aspergillus pseudonomiae]|uniref:Uncharacterized protein n=1 Tax=Aspergillus pseudonomiae TaxID=1506151 RepID=A0A5N7DJY0_9EURO|nr:uncharacterized protein BDV37DRAFT_269759 [Aspergillus pseudonomiae]KAB8255452.1 hypothetical protein BDV32DRAFT_112331 [Aspergillus pseudonomiae]KAE8406732.1 hypothetical protein BDV37DRAFT_269759 [Aspergillus pseudonomiae]